MRSRASFAVRAAISRARSQRRSLHTTSATLAMGECDDDPAAPFVRSTSAIAAACASPVSAFADSAGRLSRRFVSRAQRAFSPAFFNFRQIACSLLFLYASLTM
jgi:hypothetical protein